MPLINWLVLGLAPSCFWLWYFRRDDPDADPEISLRVFMVGIGSTALLLLVKPWISPWVPEADGTLRNQILRTVFLVGFLEEAVKLDAFLLGAYLLNRFRGPLDGIAYGIAAGLGFATVENIYLVSRAGELDLIFLRGATATFAHIGFTGFAGFWFGMARGRRRSVRHSLQAFGFLGAILLHTTYAVLIKPPVDRNLLAVLGILPALHIFLLWGRHFGVRKLKAASGGDSGNLSSGNPRSPVQRRPAPRV
ncbi:MAG: PrsW family intramembrane metalloprotease [Planctomycetota bacterium]